MPNIRHRHFRARLSEVLQENANWPVPQPIADADVLIQLMAAGSVCQKK